jgi:hypothetical protein
MTMSQCVAVSAYQRASNKKISLFIVNYQFVIAELSESRGEGISERTKL